MEEEGGAEEVGVDLEEVGLGGGRGGGYERNDGGV